MPDPVGNLEIARTGCQVDHATKTWCNGPRGHDGRHWAYYELPYGAKTRTRGRRRVTWADPQDWSDMGEIRGPFGR
jgi:hypothetical protein